MSTVLVVEDEARIASFVSKGLRAAGLSVEVTGSGRQAVARACQEGIDLILLDVGLPDVDGFEVLERIRGQGVSTPVIMLTARSSVEDRVAGLSGGADDYVAKPFAFEELLARVRLRMRPQGREPGGGSAPLLGSPPSRCSTGDTANGRGELRTAPGPAQRAGAWLSEASSTVLRRLCR